VSDPGAILTRLVHVSRDAVFSGSPALYDETCLPDPVTPYGAAKAAAETAVRLLAPAAAVVRTSLIIGHGGSEHERLIHALAAGTHDGVLFTDDIRLDPGRLAAGRRADARMPGALDVRLDSSATQARVGTRLRGAREFLQVR